jgi:hypothetical protein
LLAPLRSKTARVNKQLAPHHQRRAVALFSQRP